MANDKLTWVELRKAVAQTANTSEQEAGQFLNALLDAIVEGLKDDQQVKIKGIGTFALKAVAPRKSVNIATGEIFTIEGYNKLTFNAESMLKESVEKRIEQPKTEEIIADINPDPMRKLGEQADEIVDILADLGQAPSTSDNTNRKIENVEPTAVVEENKNEATELTTPDQNGTNVIEDSIEKEKQKVVVAEEPTNSNTPHACKCKKWVCWMIWIVILLSIIGTGIYFRNTLIQWWHCMQDCQPLEENIEEIVDIPEVTDSEIIPLTNRPREYVNFVGIERVGKNSRLAWIAYKHYAQKDLWVFIYEANRDIIKHPAHVIEGQYIRIPELSEEYRNLYNPELRQLVDSLAIEYLKK